MEAVKQIILVIVVLAGFGCVSAALSQPLVMAKRLLRAEKGHQRIPVLSAQFPQLNEQTAWEVQKAYANRRLAHDTLLGFKAGLTAKPAQARFGLNQPAAGVLFSSGRLGPGAVIVKANYHTLMLETEMGFVLDKPLNRPISDIRALKAAVKQVLPVIELPDLGFEDMKSLKGIDIIAANVAARKVILGSPFPVKDLGDLNGIGVTLYLDGKVVNQGRGSDALGDQWQALAWLANTMMARGWSLEPGQVLITGALGRMVPGKPGAYVADFKDLGRLEFMIR